MRRSPPASPRSSTATTAELGSAPGDPDPDPGADAAHVAHVAVAVVTSQSQLPTGPEKTARVRAMFDTIAPRYDLVNRVMTFGLDQAWRRRTVTALALPPGRSGARPRLWDGGSLPPRGTPRLSSRRRRPERGHARGQPR